MFVTPIPEKTGRGSFPHINKICPLPQTATCSGAVCSDPASDSVQSGRGEALRHTAIGRLALGSINDVQWQANHKVPSGLGMSGWPTTI